MPPRWHHSSWQNSLKITFPPFLTPDEASFWERAGTCADTHATLPTAPQAAALSLSLK